MTDKERVLLMVVARLLQRAAHIPGIPIEDYYQLDDVIVRVQRERDNPPEAR